MEHTAMQSHFLRTPRNLSKSELREGMEDAIRHLEDAITSVEKAAQVMILSSGTAGVLLGLEGQLMGQLDHLQRALGQLDPNLVHGVAGIPDLSLLQN